MQRNCVVPFSDGNCRLKTLHITLPRLKGWMDGWWAKSLSDCLDTDVHDDDDDDDNQSWRSMATLFIGNTLKL